MRKSLTIIKDDYLKVTKLNWLYIDINSYFATIEQQVDPTLRGRPIVVVPALTDTTCAIAVSYEAKLLGIKTGTKIYEAKKLCPELICIVAKHEIYVKYHKKIFNEVNKHLYVDHVFSIDEVACKLTGELCKESKAVELARKIKVAIKENVGDYISCSIGIAPNRYLAKVATNMQKPNGLVVINPTDIPQKLYPLKLSDLPGIGRSTYKKLTTYGIDSVEKLCKIDAMRLRKLWGSIWGEKIWYLLRGVDIPLEKTKSTTIGHSQVLAPELRNIESARAIALTLLLRAAERLRDRKLYTSNIILSIKTIEQEILSSKIRVETSSDSSTLSKALLKGWDELIVSKHKDQSSNPNNKPFIIKKISISLTNLEEKSKQLSFADFANNKSSIKNQLLSKTMDKLNSKYGAGTIVLGQMPNKKNTKASVVAFGYIPKE